MRDDLEERFGASVDLIEGRGGVFEIARDGALVFSKSATGRFPSNDEVENLGV